MATPTRRSAPRRRGRWQRFVLGSLAAVVIVIALARWALDWEITRRFIADKITAALDGALGGASLEVSRIEHLGWGELSGGELVLRDASGVERGRAEDITATFSVWPLLGSLLLGRDPIAIPVRTAHIGRLDVDLEYHDGQLMVGGPDDQIPPPPDRGDGRGFRLTFGDLHIDAGTLDVATDTGPVTASFHDLDAGLELSSTELAVTLRSAPLSITSPLGAVSVHAFGRVKRQLANGEGDGETEGDLLVIADLEGAVSTTMIAWDGPGWTAVTATEIPYDSLRVRLEDWPEAAQGRVVARVEQAPGEDLAIYARADLQKGELTFHGGFDPAAGRLLGSLAVSESDAARWWGGEEDVAATLSATLDASTEPLSALLDIHDLTVRVDDVTARRATGRVSVDTEEATAALALPAWGVSAAGRYDHKRQLVDARLAIDTRGRAFWQKSLR